MRFALAVPVLLLSTPCMAQMVSSGVVGYGTVAQINNPVSMVFEQKQTQTLADGTHINIVSHEYFYRDNVGRTRVETEFVTPFFGQGQAVRSVSVRDPLARTFTTWQTGATNGTVHTFSQNDDTPPQRPLATTTTNGNQSHTVVPVRKPKIAATPRPKATTEQLGTLDMQGVPCEASRTTFVYPIDFMGNDRPITTVTQRCQSRELGKDLLMLIEDPRSGTHSTALQSISRNSPDPSLFQPPPDYVDSRPGAH